MSAVFNRIKSHPKFGRGVGVARCARVMETLRARPGAGAPRIVHVVGSNGKGTTAAVLACLLAKHGRRVGLFTSPHVYAFNERFRINSRPLPDARLLGAYEEVCAHIRAAPALDLHAFGGFELMTLMAAALFLTPEVDVAVIEAGIGGRWDPTRAFGGDVAVLTALDLEHTQLLGDTLEAIAADKLDVVSAGAAVVTGRHGAALDSRVRHMARRAGKIVLEAAASGPAMERAGATSSEILRENAQLALEAARYVLGAATGTDGLAAACARCLATLRLPVRCEVLARAPLVVADAAHTPAAAARVAAAFAARVAPAPVAIALGVSTDKNARGIVDAVADIAAACVAFAAAHKGLDPQALTAMLAERRANIPVVAAADARAAVAQARAWRASGWPVLALGGVFSAAEFATAWRGGDVEALSFY